MVAKTLLNNLKKINWQVRAKNTLFRIQVIVSIVGPILIDMGVNYKDLTTWASVGAVVAQAVSNPIVVFSIVVGLLHAISDPTTVGFGDSKEALKYSEPRKGE